MMLDYFLKVSFYFTYVLLLTTGTVTFIEALRTNNPLIRHIMNLETIISLIAGYFYGVFLQEIQMKTIDWNQLVFIRYQDWCISTPLMLLALCLVLKKKSLLFSEYLIILVFNYAMLLCGYLGEKRFNKFLYFFIGFVFFGMLFGYIYYKFVYMQKYLFENYLLFFYYFFVWSLYGIVYLFQEKEKNLSYNILDFVSKCFIGLTLWAYYINIFYW
jgi:bacteriorhodopsin